MKTQILLDDALEEIIKRAEKITDTRFIDIQDAGGCCLAEDIYAGLDNPPFSRSPVDGYAVRAEDIQEASAENPVSLKVTACIYAGENGKEVSLKPGEACRIMTGAPFPEGADTAVKQEDTDYGEKQVKIYKSQDSWDNYCFQGEDYKKGTLLLKKDTRISFAEQGILAGLGREKVLVYRRPVIRVIVTGDELIQPGNSLRPGKIYDSNGSMVQARLKELGFPAASLEHCGDSEKEVAGLLKKAAEDADVILTTGGVSVGKKDILHGALDLLGAEKIFWRVRLQPGMPTIFSVYKNTQILSLSGNPFGVMANLELLLRPMLAAMTDNPCLHMERIQAVMDCDFEKKSKVRRFVRAVYKEGKISFPEGIFSSGAIGTLRGCNCLLDIPAGKSCVRKGEMVEVWKL